MKARSYCVKCESFASIFYITKWGSTILDEWLFNISSDHVTAWSNKPDGFRLCLAEPRRRVVTYCYCEVVTVGQLSMSHCFQIDGLESKRDGDGDHPGRQQTCNFRSLFHGSRNEMKKPGCKPFKLKIKRCKCISHRWLGQGIHFDAGCWESKQQEEMLIFQYNVKEWACDDLWGASHQLQ